MTIDYQQPIHCACFNVRRAARKITQAYDLALKPSGLSATQFTLLAMLEGCDQDAGITLTTLAHKLGMDRTTLTRNLALAEKKRWVTVEPGEDRRERVITLTTAGQSTLDKAMPHWIAVQTQFLEKLTKPGLEELLSLTRKLEQ